MASPAAALPQALTPRRRRRGPLHRNGEEAWFGRPKDDQFESLRSERLKATDLEDRQAIAAKIQQRAFEVVPYVPTGRFEAETAYRKNPKGWINTSQAMQHWYWDVGQSQLLTGYLPAKPVVNRIGVGEVSLRGPIVA
jgi:ABC-type transport system substrate-binding protein